METTETDLGMFSMFGRTGAHKKEAHKKGPHKSTNFFHFWHLMAFLWRLSVKHISITHSLTYSLLQKS